MKKDSSAVWNKLKNCMFDIIIKHIFDLAVIVTVKMTKYTTKQLNFCTKSVAR